MRSSKKLTYSFAIWQQIGAAIEAKRLKTKALIDEAESVAEAKSIFETMKWPSPL